MITRDDLTRMIDDEAFVLLRYPGDTHIELILQRDDRLHTDENFRTEGFYMAPFDRKKHPVIVLPFDRTHSIRFETAQLDTAATPAQLQKTGGTTPQAHQQRVEQAIDLIRQGRLQKIVLAAYEDWQGDWDPVASFMRLTEAFPQSLVYYFHHPRAVSMLGATPELLFKYDKHMGLMYSLAGTKFDERPWTAKEKQEQKFVTDYLIQKLLGWQLVLSQDGPYDHRQGHLRHLRTDIRFIMNKPEKDLPRLLKYLAPTPAVAGLPKDEAMKYIEKLEDFDRRYYTGFLGWKGTESGRFYVNLRSAEIRNDGLRLMAGGGITQASIPQDEWEEIKQKMQILKPYLSA